MKRSGQLASVWVNRVGRLVRALEAAQALGLPLTRVLDREWARAVCAVPFSSLPRSVRDHLRTLVDVGANRGDWLAAMLELCRPELCYAFEPNPEVFASLESRFRSRPVRCIRAAVGASPGVAELHIEAQSELSSIRELSTRGRQIHGVAPAPLRTLEVPLVTLDEALSPLPEVSLLKLDVQGYESAVIDGARGVLSRTRCLVTEVMYERDYYGGALPCLELVRLIEDVSPLRLSCISAPALAPDGRGAWADAVFINDMLAGGGR